MHARFYCGFLALIALTTTALGETNRRIAIIDVDDAEVLTGNALNSPPTGKLMKGDQVIVVREEENQFLAIQPPRGSISWIKQIHLGKVELGEGNRANVPVMVEGAEVRAGINLTKDPTNKVTLRLPKGSIVEVVGQGKRVDNATWYPIVPPEGDYRWIVKGLVRKGEALASPAPYTRTDPPPFTVGAAGPETRVTNDGVVKPAVAGVPKVLTEHALWAKAGQAERSGDYATAKHLYAQIYKDLWESKAERDAIVICYNRYTRSDEMLKSGATPTRSESRRDQPVSRETETPRSSSTGPAPAATPPVAAAGKWSNAGYLQELQKVFVDNEPVFAFQDEKGNVAYYVTAVSGINLKNYNGRRIQVFGPVTQRPELYKPHLSVEKIEVVK